MKKENTTKKDNWFKENIGFIVFITIFLVLCLVIIFFPTSGDSNSDNNTNISPSEVKKVAGLNDIVIIDDLSFKLLEVNSYEKGNKTRFPQLQGNYVLKFDFSVTNLGKDIKEVYDCGTLLFENGFQYEYRLDPVTNEYAEDCYYYELVPGATKFIEISFFFSDKKIGAISWEDVPGSKITLFSEQKKGLLKYTIDKKEINKNFV